MRKLIFLVPLLMPLSLRAQNEVSFQGVIQQNAILLNDTTDVTVRIYDQSEGGSAVFIETHPLVPVVDGLFSISIGSQTTLDPTLIDGGEWLSIAIGDAAAPEMTPRSKITPTPSSLNTRGLHVDNSGKVGIGTDSPEEFLHVLNPVGRSVVELGGAGTSGPNGLVFQDDIDGNGVQLFWRTSSGRLVLERTSAGSGIDAEDAFYYDPATGYFRFYGQVYLDANPLGWGTLVSNSKLRVIGQEELILWGYLGTEVILDQNRAFRVCTNNISSCSTEIFKVSESGNIYNNGTLYANGFVGINLPSGSPSTPLHVSRNVSAAASTPNHVALIDNISTGSSADVLALRVGRTDAPETSNAYISFKYNGESAAGFIRGNGAGGIELSSTGSDYAEYLPPIDPTERFEPGDVVGVRAGHVTKRTENADQIMVVSTAPVVVGNHTAAQEDEMNVFPRIAFIGQAPVKVIGSVHEGDFLIPSGLEDGTALGVNPADFRADQLALVLGTAWASVNGTGISKVNSAIGIDQKLASARVITALQDRQNRLQSEIDDVRIELLELKRALVN